jgi:hypothetical protein
MHGEQTGEQAGVRRQFTKHGTTQAVIAVQEQQAPCHEPRHPPYPSMAHVVHLEISGGESRCKAIRLSKRQAESFPRHRINRAGRIAHQSDTTADNRAQSSGHRNCAARWTDKLCTTEMVCKRRKHFGQV